METIILRVLDRRIREVVVVSFDALIMRNLILIIRISLYGRYLT